MFAAHSTVMPQLHQRTSATDLPLDFTEFLSARLGLERAATLSLLGEYLLGLETAKRTTRGVPKPRSADSA
jgi:hypothetical protein